MNTCLIHAGHETCLKNITFTIIFHFQHTHLCRTVTHFIIMAHISLSKQICFLQRELGLAFVDKRNIMCISLWIARRVFMGNTHLKVMQFRFIILKYNELSKYPSEYTLFWDRIRKCIRPISSGLVSLYSGLYFFESSRVLTQLLVFLYCKCLWRGLKFVIRKVTGRCELQRICYNNKPGARRTLKIGKYYQY